MQEDVVRLVGNEPGPTSIILVGVHGDETCGVEACEQLLPDLTIQKGQALFACGNPRAVRVGKRCTDANLNRLFKPADQLSPKDKASYEFSRAQFLAPYLQQADALLDVHASFTPTSRAFAICEPNASGIVKYLPVDLVVSGFDRVEPGGTDYFMNSIGKIGICLECGYLGDPGAVQKARDGILAFLQARGHVDTTKSRQRKQTYVRMYDLYLTQSSAFVLEKPFEDFEVVARGQVIGTDGNTLVWAPKQSVILFARNLQQPGEEAFLLGEQRDSLA